MPSRPPTPRCGSPDARASPQRYALERAAIAARIVAAVDVSPLANTVYRCNFPDTPMRPCDVARLPRDFFDAAAADLWLLAPPCQPYTRNGAGRDAHDPRSGGLLHLIDAVLPAMRAPPSLLLLENVCGFAESDTRRRLIARLHELRYDVREQLLSPVHFGVPNSRMRYFLLARRDGACRWPPLPPAPIRPATEDDNGDDAAVAAADGGNGTDAAVGRAPARRIGAYLESSADATAGAVLTVPVPTLLRCGRLLDVVVPASRRSCCFTKAYGRYVEGTGSVLYESRDRCSGNNGSSDDDHVGLAIVHNAFRRYIDGDADAAADIARLHLRYFSPREIARLHGFPDSFSWPSHCSERQLWRLLGNSLSVDVVAPLLSGLVRGDWSSVPHMQATRICRPAAEHAPSSPRIVA